MNRIIMKSNVAEQELNLVDNKIVLDKDDDIDLEYKGNDVRLVFDVRANTHVNLSYRKEQLACAMVNVELYFSAVLQFTKKNFINK